MIWVYNMKKILTLALFLSASVAFGQGLERVPASRILGSAEAGSHTNRNSAALNKMISDIGNRQKDIIVDAGDWTIDANVSFPTNIGLIFDAPGAVNVSSGFVLTINGYLEAQPGERVFKDISGIVTGCPKVLHIDEAWGTNNVNFDTNCQVTLFWDKDYRDDITTNNFESTLSNSPLYNLDRSNGVIQVTGTNTTGATTGSVVTTQTPTGRTVVVSFPDPSAGNIAGFINRAWVSSTGANEAVISEGEGMALGKYWRIETVITNTAASVPAGRDFVHYFIDDSDTTYPTNVAITNALTVPIWNKTRAGYYNGNDRYIGSLYTDVSGAAFAFQSNEGGRTMLGTDVSQVHSSAVPNVTWTVPNLLDGSVVTPFSAVEALIHVKDDDNAGILTAAVTIKEIADVDVIITLDGEGPRFATVINHSDIEGSVSGWSVLGPSRDIRIYSTGSPTSGNLFQILGWGIRR